MYSHSSSFSNSSAHNVPLTCLPVGDIEDALLEINKLLTTYSSKNTKIFDFDEDSKNSPIDKQKKSSQNDLINTFDSLDSIMYTLFLKAANNCLETIEKKVTVWGTALGFSHPTPPIDSSTDSTDPETCSYLLQLLLDELRFVIEMIKKEQEKAKNIQQEKENKQPANRNSHYPHVITILREMANKMYPIATAYANHRLQATSARQNRRHRYAEIQEIRISAGVIGCGFVAGIIVGTIIGITLPPLLPFTMGMGALLGAGIGAAVNYYFLLRPKPNPKNSKSPSRNKNNNPPEAKTSREVRKNKSSSPYLSHKTEESLTPVILSRSRLINEDDSEFDITQHKSTSAAIPYLGNDTERSSFSTVLSHSMFGNVGQKPSENSPPHESRILTLSFLVSCKNIIR